jgi:hypothetical protein
MMAATTALWIFTAFALGVSFGAYAAALAFYAVAQRKARDWRRR